MTDQGKIAGVELHAGIGSRNGRYIAVSEIDVTEVIATKGQINSSSSSSSSSSSYYVVCSQERGAAAVVPSRPLPLIIMQIWMSTSSDSSNRPLYVRI